MSPDAARRFSNNTGDDDQSRGWRELRRYCELHDIKPLELIRIALRYLVRRGAP